MTLKDGQLPCRATFYSGGLNEDDSPRQSAEYVGACLFGETTGETLTADSRLVKITAKAVIKGDPAPTLPIVYGGEFTVQTPQGERALTIARARRVSPGGRRVRHTILDLS